MNWSHVLRIAWKDYRRNGALWLAFVAFWLLCLTYVTATAFYTQNFIAPLTVEQTLFLVAATAMIYALSWGAITFSSEHEEKTYGLLRALPLHAKQVFYGKLFFGVNSTILLVAALGVICLSHALLLSSRGGNYAWGSYDELGAARMELMSASTMGILVPLVMALGMFWSLRIKRPLVALAVTGVTAVLIPYVCALTVAVVAQTTLDAEFGSQESSLGMYVGSLLGLMALVLFVADRYLVVKWLPNYSAANGLAASAAASTPPPGGGSSLGRFIWLQRRETLWPCIVLGAASLMFSVLAADFVLEFAALLAACLGIITFYQEHQEKRYRLLAQLGVRASAYWASRLLVPAVITTIVTAIAWLRIEPIGYLGREGQTGIALIYGCLSVFSLAQFFSLACSSMIISIAATLISSIVAGVWMALCLKFRVPSALGCLPLVILPLLASYLRVPRWFRDTGSWRQWVVPAAPMLLLTLGLPMATGTYRIYQVPSVVLPAALANPPGPPTVDELAGAAAYRAVFAKLPRSSDSYASWQIGGVDDPELVAWTTDHPALVEELVEATRRASIFPDDYRYSWDYPPHDIDPALTGGSVLLISGRKAIEQHDVDGAWEYYAAALRLARHQHDRFADMTACVSSFAIEQAVCRALIPWAMMPENTADKTESTAVFLDDYRRSQPTGSNALANDYRHIKSLVTDPMQIYPTLNAAERERADLMLLLPWEMARLDRLTDYAYTQEFEQLRRAESGDLRDLDQLYDPDQDPQLQELASTTAFGGVAIVGQLAPAFAQAEHVRRGTLYQLAAIVYHLKNGEYPRDFSTVKLRGRALPADTFAPGEKMKLIVDDAEVGAHIASQRAGPITFSDGRYELLHFLLPSFDDWSSERFATRLKRTTEAGRAEASATQSSKAYDVYERETPARYWFGRDLYGESSPWVALLRKVIRDILRSPEDRLRLGILHSLRADPRIATELLPELAPLLEDNNIEVAVAALHVVNQAIRTQDLRREDFATCRQFISSRQNSTDFGVPIRNPGNGHFYEYVHEDASWEEAKTAASQRVYREMPGYLVTITSRDEDDFLAYAFIESNDVAHFGAWAGGARVERPGVWKWVCGPETGDVFWRLDHDPQAVGYANWWPGEPRDSDHQEFLMWLGSTRETWWTAANSPSTSYIVEYSLTQP